MSANNNAGTGMNMDTFNDMFNAIVNSSIAGVGPAGPPGGNGNGAAAALGLPPGFTIGIGPPPLGHGGVHVHHPHVCMLEGDGYEPSSVDLRKIALEKEKNDAYDEIQRLRSLLTSNNIQWTKPLKSETQTIESARSARMSQLRRSASASNLPKSNRVLRHRKFNKKEESLPHFPNEVLLRILGYAVTSAAPIIDPFFKINKGNLTKDERPAPRKRLLAIHFLSTCKAFHLDGTRLLIANNDFIFTQVAALGNFARLPISLRSTIKNLTIRVIGRYYDDVARKQDFSGVCRYHSSMERLILPVLARPAGMFQDRGVQSYCWQQVADFLKALMIVKSHEDGVPKEYTKLLPHLETLRLDLVNFCEHVPYPGPSFASVVRWRTSRIVEEILVTGGPDTGDFEAGEEYMLRHLLTDEGLFGSARPVFVSSPNGTYLKPLTGRNVALHVARPGPRPSPSSKAYTANFTHPEGGGSPEGNYGSGRTIWKWASDDLSKPKEKRWVEFDRKTGYPADDLDPTDINSDWEDADEDGDDDDGSNDYDDDGDDDMEYDFEEYS